MFKEHKPMGPTKKGCCSPKPDCRFWESLGCAQEIYKVFLKVLTGLAVLIREQVVGQRGCVCQALQDNVDVASIAQVEESCSRSLLPVHANRLWGKDDPLWQSHSLGSVCRETTFEKSFVVT